MAWRTARLLDAIRAGGDHDRLTPPRAFPAPAERQSVTVDPGAPAASG
ncbi:hypothetical protein NCC78_20830 [Micromonospora phytophila]|nr:hypothetical protein [Micromonospora phytophila]MCM0677115.1 hypothetical protein [Micromonospora phytophila]